MKIQQAIFIDTAIHDLVEKSDIRSVLQSIAEEVTIPVTVYLWGGTALVYHGIRNETGDVDTVIPPERDRNHFTQAARSAGFELEREGTLETSAFTEFSGPDDQKLDIFDSLPDIYIPDGIRSRSNRIFEHSHLDVRILSIEDAFLQKMFGGRKSDTRDLATMFETRDLDIDLMVREIEYQREYFDQNLHIPMLLSEELVD